MDELEASSKGRTYNPFKGRSSKCKVITAGIVLFVCVGAALLGWGLHKLLHKTYPMTVFLPLWIYPEVGAWDPLYTA